VNKIKFSKNDIDHVDFAVPARIKNLTCWTTASEVCWSVRLRTFTTAVKKALAEFFSFFDVLQYFRLYYKLEIYTRQDFPFLFLVPTFEQDHLSKNYLVTPYRSGCTTTLKGGKSSNP
jgi:hypothetical protein